jgi:hypothetical protein
MGWVSWLYAWFVSGGTSEVWVALSLARGDVDVHRLVERHDVVREVLVVELAVVVAQVGPLEALTEAFLDDQRVRADVGDGLVERGDEVLADGMGVDDDVVTGFHLR